MARNSRKALRNSQRVGRAVPARRGGSDSQTDGVLAFAPPRSRRVEDNAPYGQPVRNRTQTDGTRPRTGSCEVRRQKMSRRLLPVCENLRLLQTVGDSYDPPINPAGIRSFPGAHPEPFQCRPNTLKTLCLPGCSASMSDPRKRSKFPGKKC